MYKFGGSCVGISASDSIYSGKKLNLNYSVMRIVRIFTVLVVLAAAMFKVSAQPGIEVGYLNSRYSTDINGRSKSGAPLNGFYVGVSDEVKLLAGLGVYIGLNYSFSNDATPGELFNDMKDFKINSTGAEKDQNLNLPIRLRYAFNIIPKVLKIQVYAGPVFSVGLSHTYNFDMKTEVAGITFDGKLKYNYYTGKFKSDAFKDEDLEKLNEKVPGSGLYKRFDIGLGGGVGVELFNFLEFKAGYDWGMMNRYKGELAVNADCRRNTFNFTLGFRF